MSPDPDPIWGQLILQLVLIALNAFFAAGEIAIISLNDNKLKKQADDGDKKAQGLLSLTSSPNNFLSTIQVGITLAGFLGAAFAADNFAEKLAGVIVAAGIAIPAGTLKALCVVIITLVLSYFTLVLGELLPKRIAMQMPDRVARLAGPIVLTLSKVFRPIITLLSKSTNALLRLLGLNPQDQAEEVTEEEIRMMMDIGEETGAIETSEKEMIENIFEFNNISAEDVMTHRTDITSLWIEEAEDEIIKTIMETGLSRFPVYDEDQDDIVGILNTRDYLLNRVAKAQKPLKELLRSAYFVPESVAADDLFRDMQQQKIHMAIVMDEYGGIAGLVTMEDLLEEIVGNIYDEFDPAQEQEVVAIDENTWRIAGNVELETLADALNITLSSSDEYDTLGGLVFSCFSAIPKDGSRPEVTVDGLIIQVESIVDHRVESALVRKASFKPETEATKEDEEA